MAPGCFACFGKPKPPEDAAPAGVSADALLVMAGPPANKIAEPEAATQPVVEVEEEPVEVPAVAEPAGRNIPAEAPQPEDSSEVPLRNNQIIPKDHVSWMRDDAEEPPQVSEETSLENGPVSPTSLLLSHARGAEVEDPTTSSSQLLMGIRAIQNASAGTQEIPVELPPSAPPPEEELTLPREQWNSGPSPPALAIMELQMEHAEELARPEDAAPAPQQRQPYSGDAAGLTPERRRSGMMPVMSTPRELMEQMGGGEEELADAHDRDLVAGESQQAVVSRMLGPDEGLTEAFLERGIFCSKRVFLRPCSTRSADFLLNGAVEHTGVPRS